MKNRVKTGFFTICKSIRDELNLLIKPARLRFPLVWRSTALIGMRPSNRLFPGTCSGQIALQEDKHEQDDQEGLSGIFTFDGF